MAVTSVHVAMVMVRTRPFMQGNTTPDKIIAKCGVARRSARTLYGSVNRTRDLDRQMMRQSTKFADAIVRPRYILIFRQKNTSRAAVTTAKVAKTVPQKR